MKKIFLGILTVLTLTLFVGCIKETEVKIDEEFTNPIGTIKCINTLDELMSDDYEPKFEINNDEYIDGEFPYINMDFPEANEINELMKAYALTNTSYLLADSENLKNNNEEGNFTVTIIPQVEFVDDKYIFININSNNYSSKTFETIGIDIENNKLLTKEEILEIANIDFDATINTILDAAYNEEGFEPKKIITDPFSITMMNRDEVIEKLKNDLSINELNFGSNKFDTSIDLKQYGKVELNDGTYDSLSPLEFKNIMTANYYINKDNKAQMVLSSFSTDNFTNFTFDLN